MSVFRVLVLSILAAALSACAGNGLKNPCKRPGYVVSYVEDTTCGPLKPVNQAMDIILGAKLPSDPAAAATS